METQKQKPGSNRPNRNRKSDVARESENGQVKIRQAFSGMRKGGFRINMSAIPVFFFKHRKPLLTWLVLFVALISQGPGFVRAENSDLAAEDEIGSPCPREMRVPDTLTPGLDHFLALVGPGGNTMFDPEAVEDVLDFTTSSKAGDICYFLDDKYDATTVYYEFEIRSDLKRLIELAFNPEIPAFAATPSSVRLTYWMEVAKGKPALPKFWTYLPDPARPLIAKAVEYSENTPDIHTGTYHAYDLDRTFILFRHKDRNVFVSLSKQRKTSGVGKKGLVLGSDNDWNYFYSGLKGVNKAGLGWVSSYMYDSFSISVYMENGNNSGVRCAVFKGLRAGWAKMNFVKKQHILKGLKRYENDLRAVVESDAMPDADRLRRSLSAINDLSSDELQGLMRRYLAVMDKKYGDVEVLSGTSFSDFVKDEDYLGKMKEEEMRAVLVLEYMKFLLGKERNIDIGRLIPNKISKK